MCCVIRLEESQGKGQQFVHANELQQVLGSYKVRSSDDLVIVDCWLFDDILLSEWMTVPRDGTKTVLVQDQDQDWDRNLQYQDETKTTTTV